MQVPVAVVRRVGCSDMPCAYSAVYRASYLSALSICWSQSLVISCSPSRAAQWLALGAVVGPIVVTLTSLILLNNIPGSAGSQATALLALLLPAAGIYLHRVDQCGARAPVGYEPRAPETPATGRVCSGWTAWCESCATSSAGDTRLDHQRARTQHGHCGRSADPRPSAVLY